MIPVKFNLRKPLHALEEKTGRRYSTGEISEIGGKLISRQSIYRMISAPDVDLSSVSMDALSNLLSFFHREGMPIKIEDLFEVAYPPIEPTKTTTENTKS